MGNCDGWKGRMQQCLYCKAAIVWNELNGLWLVAAGNSDWASLCMDHAQVDGGVGHVMDEGVARGMDRWVEGRRKARNSMR